MTKSENCVSKKNLLKFTSLINSAKQIFIKNFRIQESEKCFDQVYDQTRGPDSQVPIWVDRIKDIDFKKVI
jgi:hypothetical protein